jgi:hypothetical protein
MARALRLLYNVTKPDAFLPNEHREWSRKSDMNSDKSHIRLSEIFRTWAVSITTLRREVIRSNQDSLRRPVLMERLAVRSELPLLAARLAPLAEWRFTAQYPRLGHRSVVLKLLVHCYGQIRRFQQISSHICKVAAGDTRSLRAFFFLSSPKDLPTMAALGARTCWCDWEFFDD